MATIYGDITNHWHCYINTWSSEDGYSLSAGLTVGIQDCGWGFQIWTGIVGTANANGASNTVNTSFNTPTGSWHTKDITSASKRFVKGHSAYNVTLSGSVKNQSGYMNGTSSASQTITVPALAHHYVSFNANGGTGAPGRADKWYGEQVTIPTTKPTRANYEFLGWSNTKDGQVAYKPGEKYWIDDANVTYYAVWKLLYVPPKFTNGLAIRTSSMTSTTPDYSGGYCYASFSYKVDTTVYSDNVAKSIVCRYYQNGSTTGVVVTPTGDLNKASGTINVHFEASINSVYYIECILTDTKDGTANIARSITTGVLPMEVANQGKSVGILSAAPSSAGLNMGGSGNPEFLVAADTTNNRLQSMAQIHGSTSSNSQGELTLSTQGLDSSGNVARGTINFIADNMKFNGHDLAIKSWLFYEHPTGEEKTYLGGVNSWYRDKGLYKHIDGPNYSKYFSLDKNTGLFSFLVPGVWVIIVATTAKSSGTGRVFAGLLDSNNKLISSSAAITNNDLYVTATNICVLNVSQTDVSNKRSYAFGAVNPGTMLLNRNYAYATMIYLGNY